MQSEHPSVERLSAYLDRDLPEHEYSALSAHLKTCEHCQREFNALTDVLETLRNLPDLEAPPGFYQRLMQRISTLGRRSWWARLKHFGFLPWLAPLSAAALVFVVVRIQLRSPADPYLPDDGPNAGQGTEAGIFSEPIPRSRASKKAPDDVSRVRESEKRTDGSDSAQPIPKAAAFVERNFPDKMPGPAEPKTASDLDETTSSIPAGAPSAGIHFGEAMVGTGRGGGGASQGISLGALSKGQGGANASARSFTLKQESSDASVSADAAADASPTPRLTIVGGPDLRNQITALVTQLDGKVVDLPPGTPAESMLIDLPKNRLDQLVAGLKARGELGPLPTLHSDAARLRFWIDLTPSGP